MKSITNRSQYIFNIFSSYFGTVMSAVIGIVTAPISIGYWGVEKYGVLAIIMSLAAYLSVSGLGIDAACGILMTKNSDLKKKENIFKKSLTLVIFFAVIFLFAVLLFTYINPKWLNLLGNMSDSVLQIASKTALIFIISFCINMPFGVVATAISSYHRMYLNNLINSIAPVISLIVLLITVKLNLDMFTFGILSSIATTLISTTRIIILVYAKRKYNNTDVPSEINNEDDRYRTIIKTGVRLTFYGLAIIVSQNIGSIIISNKMDVTKVPPYSITFRLFYLAYMFITMTNVSAAPLLGKEFSIKNWKGISTIYNNLQIVTMFLAGGLWLGSILFFKPVINVWVGHIGYAGLLTTCILGAYFFISGLSNLNYVVINSLNYTKGIGFISWTEAVIFVTAAFFFIDKIGITAVALGLLISSVSVSLWILPSIIKKRSKNMLFYDKKVFLKSGSIILGMVLVAILNELLIKENIFKNLSRVLILCCYIILMIYMYKDQFIIVFKRFKTTTV